MILKESMGKEIEYIISAAVYNSSEKGSVQNYKQQTESEETRLTK